MTDEDTPSRGLSRRSMVRAALAIGGTSALAACQEAERSAGETTSDPSDRESGSGHEYPRGVADRSELPDAQHAWDNYLVHGIHGPETQSQHQLILGLSYEGSVPPTEDERASVEGDRDVVVAPYDGEVTVYENAGAAAAAHSLDFRAVEADGSTAYGAEVTVTGPGGPTTVQQTVRSDFLSQESRVRHVGLGGRERVDVTVTWPDGTRRTYEDVAADQRVRITKGGIETVATYDE